MSRSGAPVLTPREVARMLADDAASWLGAEPSEVTVIEPLWATVRYVFAWGSLLRDADMRDSVLHDVLTVVAANDVPALTAWRRTDRDATYISDDPRWRAKGARIRGVGRRVGRCTDWTAAGVAAAVARNTEVTRRVLTELGLPT